MTVPVMYLWRKCFSSSYFTVSKWENRVESQDNIHTQIAREGFMYLPKRGKGSHERWRHPLM